MSRQDGAKCGATFKIGKRQRAAFLLWLELF